MKDLILDNPEGMVSTIDINLEYHWTDLTNKLTSKIDADYETYFLLSSKNKNIVPRAGYYLGYLIAKEIGETKSISEMAQMKHTEILPLIKWTIDKLRKEKVKGTFKNN